MSLFDNDSDDQWYDAENKFQKKVLQNAEKLDVHPIVHLAKQQEKALEAMTEFAGQEPLVNKQERVAIESDVKEAEEAISRAYKVMPSGVIQDE